MEWVYISELLPPSGLLLILRMICEHGRQWRFSVTAIYKIILKIQLLPYGMWWSRRKALYRSSCLCKQTNAMPFFLILVHFLIGKRRIRVKTLRNNSGPFPLLLPDFVDGNPWCCFINRRTCEQSPLAGKTWCNAMATRNLALNSLKKRHALPLQRSIWRFQSPWSEMGPCQSSGIFGGQTGNGIGFSQSCFLPPPHIDFISSWGTDNRPVSNPSSIKTDHPETVERNINLVMLLNNGFISTI
jgi:hypothetical protein